MKKCKKSFFLLLFFISIIFIFSLALFFSFSVVAATPSFHIFKGPCYFIRNEGTVNCSVGTVIVGYRVTDLVTSNGTFTTLRSGAYGNYLNNGDSNLQVIGTSDNNGDTINFIINGFNADQTDTFAAVSTTILTLTVTDKELPTLISINKNNNSYLNATDKLNLTVSDNKGIDKLIFDNGNGINTTFTNNTLFSPAFTTDGNHYIFFYIKDVIGNVYTGTYNYIYDTTKPKIEIVNKVNNSYINSTDKIILAVNDATPISTIKYKLGESLNWINSNSLTLTHGFSVEGNNYLHIRINDSASNINITTYNFNYDTMNPSFVDIGPKTIQNTSLSSLQVTLWATINENGACAYGTSNSSFGNLILMNSTNGLNHTVDLTFTANATPTYYFKCNDTSGNINVEGNSTTFIVGVVTPKSDNPVPSPGGGSPKEPSTIPKEQTTPSMFNPSTTSVTKDEAEKEDIQTKETQVEEKITLGASNGSVEQYAKNITSLSSKTISLLKTKNKMIFFSMIIIVLLLIVLLIIIKKKKSRDIVNVN